MAKFISLGALGGSKDASGWYPLVMTNIAIENGPVEIVDLPIYPLNMLIFHSYVMLCKRLPEGNCWSWYIVIWYHMLPFIHYGWSLLNPCLSSGWDSHSMPRPVDATAPVCGEIQRYEDLWTMLMESQLAQDEIFGVGGWWAGVADFCLPWFCPSVCQTFTVWLGGFQPCSMLLDPKTMCFFFSLWADTMNYHKFGNGHLHPKVGVECCKTRSPKRMHRLIYSHNER